MSAEEVRGVGLAGVGLASGAGRGAVEVGGVGAPPLVYPEGKVNSGEWLYPLGAAPPCEVRQGR